MCTSEVAIASYRTLRENLSRSEIAARLHSGSLVRVRRGIYASDAACAVAVEAVAHGGMPACVSAARHLGLWVLDDSDDLHVWMGSGGHRRHPEECGCVAHWDDGPASGSFGSAPVARILRQILSCKGVEAFFVTLESALKARLLTRAGWAWLRAHVNGEGREAMELARSDADSGLESLLRWRLRGRRLRVRTQVRILGVGVVDVLIGERLIIEADGKDNHEDDEHRHKDLVRDANAAVWGYATLRFDYALIVHEWELVEAAILGAVAAGHHLR